MYRSYNKMNCWNGHMTFNLTLELVDRANHQKRHQNDRIRFMHEKVLHYPRICTSHTCTMERKKIERKQWNSRQLNWSYPFYRIVKVKQLLSIYSKKGSHRFPMMTIVYMIEQHSSCFFSLDEIVQILFCHAYHTLFFHEK